MEKSEVISQIVEDPKRDVSEESPFVLGELFPLKGIWCRLVAVHPHEIILEPVALTRKARKDRGLIATKERRNDGKFKA